MDAHTHVAWFACEDSFEDSIGASIDLVCTYIYNLMVVPQNQTTSIFYYTKSPVVAIATVAAQSKYNTEGLLQW